MRLVRRLGQAGLGIMFVKLGSDAALEPGGRPVKAAEFGVSNPELAVRLNGATMVLGGLALAFDILPRVAALTLAIVMVPTTLAGHAFWKSTDPAAQKRDQIQFLKNIGLIGGLLVLASSKRK